LWLWLRTNNKKEMKKSIITLMLAVLSATSFAQSISLQQAQQRAEKFLKKEAHPQPLPQGKGVATAHKTPSLEGRAGGEAPYYIFNADDGQGFVIVSGDERARDILGYSTSGSLTAETMPCGLEMLLEMYREEIEGLPPLTSSLNDEVQAYGNETARKKVMAARRDVSPLVTCQWGQSSPYNLECPRSGGSRCITGCSATAMSQILYYWGKTRGYNIKATRIPAYTTRTLKLSLDELPATTFDWESMANTCNTGASGQAASKLCRYVGQGLEMDYGVNGSEAWGTDMANVYRDYFGIDNHVRLAFRQDYNYDDWDEMIYNELAEGRPVNFGGSYINSSGTSWSGHGFVCDGYQESTGKYHINFGWNGQSNGYYELSALGSGTSTFNICLRLILGIQPPVEGHEYEREAERTAVVDMSLTGARAITREHPDQDFEGITVFNAVYNHLQYNTELIAGLGLYDAKGNLLDVLAEAPLGRFDRYDGFGLEFTFGNLALGRGLKDGTYYIRAISKAYPQPLPEGKGDLSDEGWLLSTGAEHNYITATITETELTLQPSVDLVVNSVGSGGSYYNRSYSASITNNGTEESRGLLYVFNSSRVVNVVQTDIEPGETKSLTLSTTSIAKITSDFDGHHVLWTNSSSVPNIALTARAVNAERNGYFEGDALVLDVSLANNGTSVYSTPVTVTLYREGTTDVADKKQFTPNVAPMSTQTERMEFNGLEYGQSYTISLTSGSYTVEQGNMTTSQPRTFYVYKVTPLQMLTKVSSLGYATFSWPFALDFSYTDAEAYIIRDFNGGSVKMERVWRVPANTGLILNGREGEFKLHALEDEEYTDDVTGNLLIGTAYGDYKIDQDNVFVLSTLKGPGLYRAGKGVTVRQFKAYMVLDGEVANSKEAFAFDFTTDGIEQMESSNLSSTGGEAVYDLTGRQLSSVNGQTQGSAPTLSTLQKGIYVIGGKKYVVR
jgi:hypothetical protein